MKLFFTLPLLILFIGCNGQTKNLHLSDLKFESIFGSDNKDSSQVYCLLGTGFFRAPSSKNTDSLVETWINKHPNADVILVSTLENPKDKLTYCWLVDKGDTINNYLIKNGGFPGGTMIRPQTYNEMTDKEKAFYNDMEKPIIKVHIDSKSYKNFIEQIKVAESYAQANKLGIWGKTNKEE
jgi:hypothetical protein